MFAKKTDYCAGETSYVALVAIAKKKGGKPINFILYRFLNVGPKGMFESVEFSGSQEKEAMKAFPFGPVVYRPINEEPEGLQGLMEEGKLPRTRVSQWKMTTDWLEDIAIDGAYRQYPEGAWVKVGKPNMWRQRRARGKKRSHLRFGELGHILKKRRLELKELEDELTFTFFEDKSTFFANEFVDEKRQGEIDDAKRRVGLILVEMKYVRDKKFSCPATP